MAAASPSVSGVAERYAAALFDLANEARSVAAVEGDLKGFDRLIDEDADFRRFVTSPLFSAQEQLAAIDAIVRRAGVNELTANFLRLVARNRRLFALKGIVKAFVEKAAMARGETTALVTSARPLSEGDLDELRRSLSDRIGRKVAIETRTDPSLLGGLVVKVGSRMIDSSLRTKLNLMKTRLKEAQ